jgi:hypothetical protein
LFQRKRGIRAILYWKSFRISRGKKPRSCLKTGLHGGLSAKP